MVMHLAQEVDFKRLNLSLLSTQCMLDNCTQLEFYILRMPNLGFLLIPYLVVDLRWNNLFKCLLSPVLCMIGLREANGEDNKNLMRPNGTGEQYRMSTQMFSSGSEELEGECIYALEE